MWPGSLLVEMASYTFYHCCTSARWVHRRCPVHLLISHWLCAPGHSSVGNVVVQSPSPAWLFVTPWTAAHQASLSFTISWSLLKLLSIESVMPSNHLTLGRPLLLLPSIFPSMRGFPSESALHIRWPKYWRCGLILWLTWELSLPFCLHRFIFYLLKSNSVLTTDSSGCQRFSFCQMKCVCVCVCVWKGEGMDQNEKHLMSLTINFLTFLLDDPLSWFYFFPPSTSFFPAGPLVYLWSLSSAFPFLSILFLTEFTHSLVPAHSPCRWYP